MQGRAVLLAGGESAHTRQLMLHLSGGWLLPASCTGACGRWHATLTQGSACNVLTALLCARIAANPWSICLRAGLTGLDLSGLYVDESDVLHLCAGLPCLRTLSLAGCKKLTGALCDALAGPSTPTPHLQALDLQRCFQLTSGSLAAFLRSPASAGMTGSGVSGHAATGPRFQFLGFSHLNLSQFQLHLSDQTSADYDDNIVPDTHTAQAVAAAAGRGDGSRDVDGPDVNSAPLATSSYTTALSAVTGSSLRILALHNCTQLSAAVLLQIAAACPQLQLLLLGGGAFTQRTGPVHAATHDLSHQMQPLIPTGTSATCVVQAVYQAVDSSPALCACKASTPIRNHLSMVSVSLVATALCLPKLQVLELTFMPPTVVPTVTRALELLRDELRLPTTPHVWDLTQQDSVQAALDMLHAVRAADTSAPSGTPAAVPHLAAALKCAVNCSSSARTTPLHTAAFGGAAGTVLQLLQLGAICDARDVGGATALFLSAEAGHHEVVQALLKAEGDLSLGNAAGETTSCTRLAIRCSTATCSPCFSLPSMGLGTSMDTWDVGLDWIGLDFDSSAIGACDMPVTHLCPAPAHFCVRGCAAHRREPSVHCRPQGPPGGGALAGAGLCAASAALA